MAYIPSAGLWGRRVIFVECPLVVRVERSGCVCPAFLFVEVVRSLGLLLVAFVFSVVGCCSFGYFGVASLLFIAGAWHAFWWKGELIWCSLSAVFVLGVLEVVLGLLMCLT